MTNDPTSAAYEALKQKLAAIEHQRWSDWQKYMQSLAKADWTQEGDTIFTYTVEQFSRWQRQIETDYKDLTPTEQASDMEQVNRYWPLIEQAIVEAETRGRIDEVDSIPRVSFGIDDYVNERLAALQANADGANGRAGEGLND